MVSLAKAWVGRRLRSGTRPTSAPSSSKELAIEVSHAPTATRTSQTKTLRVSKRAMVRSMRRLESASTASTTPSLRKLWRKSRRKPSYRHPQRIKACQPCFLATFLLKKSPKTWCVNKWKSSVESSACACFIDRVVASCVSSLVRQQRRPLRPCTRSSSFAIRRSSLIGPSASCRSRKRTARSSQRRRSLPRHLRKRLRMRNQMLTVEAKKSLLVVRNAVKGQPLRQS